MRVGLISDLHIDINKDYPIVELTAETAAEQMTDVLVISVRHRTRHCRR